MGFVMGEDADKREGIAGVCLVMSLRAAEFYSLRHKACFKFVEMFSIYGQWSNSSWRAGWGQDCCVFLPLYIT